VPSAHDEGDHEAVEGFDLVQDLQAQALEGLLQ